MNQLRRAQLRKTCSPLGSLFLLAASLSLCAPLNAQTISNVAPAAAAPGDTVILTGSGFGSDVTKGSVTFGSVTVTNIQSWSPTAISVEVPNVAPGQASVVVTVAGSASAPAQFTANLPSIALTANPAVIPPTNGKLPASVNLSVFEPSCDSKKGIDLTQGAAPYTLTISGGGLAVGPQVSPGRCGISGVLTIDSNTAAGTYRISLLDKNKQLVGSANISVLGATAGAIPPGLPPQVDVIWEVMSQKNCGDVFGTRVAASDYCIQIKIGNNSGYPIQLAGIGFKTRLNGIEGAPEVTIANSSYASTRAVLQNEQAYSGRNITYHGLQSVGLIMAAFIPFFGTQHANGTINNARNHWSTLSSIVSGPVVKGFDTVWPDPAIAQLNNLDDESFRDSLVIQNNAQIQTVVFVEKQTLTYQLKKLYQDNPNLRTESGASDNMETEGSGSSGANKAGANEVGASGGTQTGSGSGSLTQKAALSVPTVNNSKNSRRLLFPSSGRFNPLSVKLALGRLVIVGQQIQYLQRIQIQSNAVPSGTSTPTITSITPACAAAGTSVTVAGANFGATQDSSAIKFGDTPGTNIKTTDWSDKSITVNVPSVAQGDVNVVVTVAGKDSAPTAFNVSAQGVPCIAAISPSTGAPADSVTITGNGFGSTPDTISFGGVKAADVAASNWTDTSIKSIVVPSVGPTAVPIPVVVTVGGKASSSSNFTMKCPSSGPCITSLSLYTGSVDTSVTITGQNFGKSQGTSTVTFGSTKATIKRASDWTDTQITTTVPSSAKPGQLEIVVTVGKTSSPSVAFTVK